MVNSVIRWVSTMLCGWCSRTGRTHLIVGNPEGPKEVYMVRYIVLKTRFLSLFIHRFLRSDEPVPHDHPWSFLTYVVSGGYVEHSFDRSKPKHDRGLFTSYWSHKTTIRLPGSLRYRSANDVHYVELEQTYSLADIGQAPLTVCLIGPRVREWGFWPTDTTFVDWRKYLKVVSVNDERIEGSE